MDERPIEEAQPRRRGRPVLTRVALVAVLVLVIAVTAFSLSPTPGALVVRAVFDRDADATTASLAEGAPVTDVRSDIAYRDGDPDALLDVYTAVGAVGARPTIVWTHGGAWISGNRKHYAGYYQRLVQAGFTVVSVGYSIAPGRRYPTAVHQLNDAHAHLLAHADELHVDPRRIVLAGDSAGAQLSAQLAAAITSPGSATELGAGPAIPAASLRGVILNCGIYDVPAMGGSGGIVGWGVKQALWAYTGDRDYAGSTAAREMSALHRVTSDFPPTFITGGNADPLTATQSKPLAVRLGELDVDTDELFYTEDHSPELGHEYQFDLALADARTALERTISFAQRVTRD